MLGLRFPEISDNFFHECYVVRDSALLKIFLNFGLVFVYFSSNKFYSYMYSFKCMSFVSFQALFLPVLYGIISYLFAFPPVIS